MKHSDIDKQDDLEARFRDSDSYAVTQEHVLAEELHLPCVSDLFELDMSLEEAQATAGHLVTVEVHIAPNEPVTVLWRDSKGTTWHLPLYWRRHRVRLPSCDVLVSQGVPEEAAARFKNSIVGVNYHPDSSCCLPGQYRFRDEEGNRWSVRIADCTLLGYGDASDHRA